MNLIKLRNAVIAAIDSSSITREVDGYFCASVEYSKFKYHEVLEVNFYTEGDGSIFYDLEHDFDGNKIAVWRRYGGETERTELTYSEAMKEFRNEFNKIGANFDGKYI